MKITKLETAIIALVLIAIILSSSSLYYTTSTTNQLMSKIEELSGAKAETFNCPFGDGATFATKDLLAAHVWAEHPIKIGVVFPLSPPGYYEGGRFGTQAMQMTVDEANQAGGLSGVGTEFPRRVELVVGDNSGIPEKGIATMEKLITRDKVVMVMGELHSAVAVAEKDVAEKYGIPFVITDAVADKITEAHLRTTFRVAPYSSQQVDVLFGVVKEYGFKNIVTLVEDSDYGLSMVTASEKVAKEMGIAFTYATIGLGVTDYTPHLLKFKELKPDLLFSIVTTNRFFAALNQAYDVGLAPIAILDTGAAGNAPELWSVCGKNAVNLATLTYTSAKMKVTEAGQHFREAYNAEFGYYPELTAMEAYDTTIVALDAIKRAGTTEPNALIDALEKTNIVGFTPIPITFGNGPGVTWHQFETRPILIVQYTAEGQTIDQGEIVYPDSMKTADLIIP
jgi:branched-chain amino acid transport system substrate-binding protein